MEGGVSLLHLVSPDRRSLQRAGIATISRQSVWPANSHITVRQVAGRSPRLWQRAVSPHSGSDERSRARLLRPGFTALKFEWGVFGKDRWLDVQLVEAAPEALGSRRDLLVDKGWFVERTAKGPSRFVRSPFDRVSTPRRVCRIQHLARTPEPAAGERAAADGGRTSKGAGGARPRSRGQRRHYRTLPSRIV